MADTDELRQPIAEAARPSSRRWLTLIPVILFVALALVFLVRIITVGTDTSFIPSALIGSKAPEFSLPPLEGLTENGTPLPGLDRASLAEGEVTVINVWASWCGPCRIEHPFLEELAKDDRFRLVGINYKDQTAGALDFLNTEGNPFDAVGVDSSGRTGIDFGVYGVPETFVIGRDGTILYKFTGPITSEEALRERLMPEIEKALAATPEASAG
jgi:cytochrome c biogenesis protein CcmG/thiol:disulfide interchange protein DsbE